MDGGAGLSFTCPFQSQWWAVKSSPMPGASPEH